MKSSLCLKYRYGLRGIIVSAMYKPLVEEYNPEWPEWFAVLKRHLGTVLDEVPHRFEHVGSTAVPGMTAKPIIDIDLVIDIDKLDYVIEALAVIGYVHTGDNGVAEREAFDLTDDASAAKLPPHHLYVCGRESRELRRHIAFREFLRQNREWRDALSRHKRELCERHGNDRQAYIDGKTALVREIIVPAMESIGE